MNRARHDLLLTLTQGGWHQQSPVTLIGAAVMDMVVSAEALPQRGGDVAAQMQGFHLGGCALNIAVALKQLGIVSRNLLPLGEGMWADRLRGEMAQRGVHSDLAVGGEDNGWCMALVEPDGERTFISIDGIENRWQTAWLQDAAPQGGLVYLSGYQLGSGGGAVLLQWMQQLPATVRVVLDIGPRIDVMPDDLLQRLIRPGVLLTLNQREAQLLGMGEDIEGFCRQLWQRTGQWVVVRFGDQGGYYYAEPGECGWVAARAVTVADSIGAGDSHTAGLLAGLALGLTPQQTMLLSNSIAGYVVSRPGGDCAPTLAQLLASEAG
ncbi:PfkB family carbohydrate kinase [Serratia odorifera]|uniref:Kinase, PfkB family n=1 Tax=Serratia odorifera DSM 4582 TaxID=667129 RepID=D4E7J7_SEROD|nr:PfkB family carbohydrate kinase [Serratia odorifera]EFE94052.1 kinase, PfkB family [Serratia odorifera DSM 4582]PNK89081.1 kinase [Serratia odorifera]RII69891.1 kinase [Serratia odorifera]